MRVQRMSVFVLAFVFAIAALQGADAGEKTEKIGKYDIKVPNKPRKDLEIALVYQNVTEPFTALVDKGIQAAKKEFGVNCYITGATDFDPQSQYKVTEDLIVKGVDGLSVMVLDEQVLMPVINQALAAGIPTTCWNVDSEHSDRLGFIGEDLEKAGAATADAMVAFLKGKGAVIISTVAANATWSQKREKGVRDVLAKHPGIKVLQLVNATGDKSTAYAACENALLANPDVDGVIDLGGCQTMWATLFKSKGVGHIDSEKPIYTSGHDLFEDLLYQIKDGYATVSFGQNPYDQGYETVKQLVQFLESGDPGVFKVVDTGLTRVDRSNVDDFIRRLKAGEPIG